MAPLLQEGSSNKFNEVFTNREDVYNYQNNMPSIWNLPENLNPIFDTENYLDFSTPINFGENN